MPAFNASLFQNDRKETDKQPDFTGPGTISKENFLKMFDQVMSGAYNEGRDGEIKLRVAGWRREASSGKKYISLQLSMDDYNATAKPATVPVTVTDDLF